MAIRSFVSSGRSRSMTALGTSYIVHLSDPIQDIEADVDDSHGLLNSLSVRPGFIDSR
jgi:hypothetical protein